MYFIYLITNLLNHKKYVGITKKTIEERWEQHLQTAYHKRKRYAIHNAIRKYGAENFKIELIEETEDSSREKFWIETYGSFGEGYNLTQGGDGTIGVIFSEEECFRRSERVKKLHHSKAVGMYGRKHSKETREKMSVSGKKLNRTGQNNPRFGVVVSEETKSKLRNKIVTEETREKLRQAAKEQYKSGVRNAKSIHNPMYGRKHSEETKEKIRQARLKRKQE